MKEPQAYKESLKQLDRMDSDHTMKRLLKKSAQPGARSLAESIASEIKNCTAERTPEGWTVYVGPLPAYIQTREAICPISENVSLQFKWLPEGSADISISFHAPRGTARQLLEECRDRPLDWTIHVEKKEANG